VKPISLCVVLAAALTACGLNVQAPDLFLLTRTGGGPRLTLLVSDDGTIRCNGHSKQLPDKMLLVARDLAITLNNDAKRGLRIPRAPDSVALYSVRVQQGTISFPDTAARNHPTLAQLELFAVQASQGPCGLGS
jgi:hypothetical protein